MTKRDYGEGVIRQRKDGTWEARYQRTGYNNGKPKSVYAKTEALVKRKLKELKVEAIKNDFVVNKNATVKDYMTHWLTAVKLNSLKPRSYDRLETTLNHQIFPYIGNYQLSSLTSDDIQELVNTLNKNRLAHSTVKKAYDAINNCFTTGVIKRDIQHNPALGVVLNTTKKKKSSDILFYNQEETASLIAASKSQYSNGKLIYRLGNAIPLVLNTGLRVSELLALKWKDNVDLKKRTISITNSIVSVIDRDPNAEHKYKLIDQESTKSESGQRILNLNDAAYEALLELQKETGNMLYVISSKNDKPISPRNMDRLLKNLCRVCNFAPNRFLGMHSLRHTFASRLFAKNVPVKVISEILGHSDIQITINIYVHLIDSQKKQAMDIINDI